MAEPARDGESGALAGLKIIDLTQMLAGPYATMMLADQGADVIKVEPLDGDGTRIFGPYRPEDSEHVFGGYFQSVNRNKRSIAVDLKNPAGRDLVKRLARDADVLVENYRHGVMERLGLGYETLREVNPRLVYATIRGFGDARTGVSPYRDWPAYDVVAQAMGGIMSITGPAPGRPVKIGPGIGDIFPATQCAFGILAAVFHAQRTGQGQFVDVGMVDAMLSLCERIVHQYSYAGIVPDCEGNAHPLLAPFGLFQCKDGWATVGCPNDTFWRLLVEAMGHREWATEPRYATNAERMRRREEVNGLVTEWTLRHTKDELKELLGGAVPVGPVNTVKDIFEDPHFAARDMIANVDHPGANHQVGIANTPIHMTETPGGVRHRAPLLGEHTDEVLRAAGMSAEEIEDLRASGAVR